MSEKYKSYNCIDLVKLIMAIFVVAIHTVPFANVDNQIIKVLWECVVRIAVPFFFLASGFLVARRADENGSDIQSLLLKHLLKIVKLYLFWSAVYLPMAIYYFIKVSFSPFESAISYIKGLIFVGENYNSWMLWYLLSTIYALLFIVLLLKLKFKRGHITIIGCGVFLFALFLNELVSYNGDMPNFLWQLRDLVSNTILNGRIFTGFFYIPIGIVLSKNRIPFFVSLLLFLGGFAGNVFFDGMIGDLFIAACSIGLFLIVAQIELPASPVYRIMRDSSTIVYFVHMYVWTIYCILRFGKEVYGPESFIVTTLVSLAIAFVHIYIKKHFKKRKAKN